MTTPAGWYADTTAPGTERYWDGNAWTDGTRPLAPPVTAGAKNRATNKRLLKWLVIPAAVLFAIIAIASTSSSKTPTSSSAVTTPKNPESNDDNKLACDTARDALSSVGQVFGDLGKGTIATQDALSPIRKAQQKLSDAASFAHTTVQVDIQALADDLGRARVALIDNDDAALTASATAISKSTGAADKICTSIGH